MAHDFSGPAPYRKNTTGKTSQEAAAVVSLRAPTLRETVYETVRASTSPINSESITDEFVKRGIIPADQRDAFVPTIRPRCSELARMGLIRNSNTRGRGLRGCSSIAWEAVPDDELARHQANLKANGKPPTTPAMLRAAKKEAVSRLGAGKWCGTDLIAIEAEAYMATGAELSELLAFMICARQLAELGTQ